MTATGMTAGEALRVAEGRVESLLRVNARQQAEKVREITVKDSELETLEAQARDLGDELEGLRQARRRSAMMDADLLARVNGPDGDPHNA